MQSLLIVSKEQFCEHWVPETAQEAVPAQSRREMRSHRCRHCAPFQKQDIWEKEEVQSLAVGSSAQFDTHMEPRIMQFAASVQFAMATDEQSGTH